MLLCKISIFILSFALFYTFELVKAHLIHLPWPFTVMHTGFLHLTAVPSAGEPFTGTDSQENKPCSLSAIIVDTLLCLTHAQTYFSLCVNCWEISLWSSSATLDPSQALKISPLEGLFMVRGGTTTHIHMGMSTHTHAHRAKCVSVCAVVDFLKQQQEVQNSLSCHFKFFPHTFMLTA